MTLILGKRVISPHSLKMFPSAKETSFEFAVEKGATTTKEELDWLSLGSFRPGLAVNHDQTTVHSVSSPDLHDRSSSESPPRQIHKKKKKEKHKHKKKKKKKSKSPDIEKRQIEKEIVFKGNKVFIEEIPGLEVEDAYRIDRKSDVNTWNYGSLYKGHVARYYGNVTYCIGPHSIPMKEDKKLRKSDFSRYYSKESQGIHYTTETILPKAQTSDFKLQNTEKVYLKEAKVDNKMSDIRDRLLDDATSLYIKGKGHEGTSEETGMTGESAMIYKTVAEFNKKTRLNPHDIDVWIQFVNFQDKFASEYSGNKKLTESSVLEKKLSIMKRAMEANPGNIELKMKYLDLCKGTMAPESVSREMEQLLFTHPTNMLLWKQYLLYHQSCVSLFTVSRVCKVYHKCFSKLIGYLEGRLHTHSISEDLHKEVLDVFVQYCYFLKQVGQMEKAIASFQALIEFNLCLPNTLNDISHEEKIVTFESFWDSGVARIGEREAKGWSYWYNSPNLQPESQPSVTDSLEQRELDIIQKEESKWKIWLAIELERQSAHWFPWRPDISQNETEDDCEDLDRLVLYDDIVNILLPIPTTYHIDLINHFLIFLGIDFGKEFSLQPCCLENLESVIEHTEMKIIKNYTKICATHENFVKCFIDQMIERFEGENYTKLVTYKLYFHFDVCKKGSKFKKFAKSLLSEVQNRNNLLVWCAYCDILWRSGSQTEAASVIETALTMNNDNDMTQKHGCLKLHRVLTEIYLGMSPQQNMPPQECNLCKAQNVLLCFTENKGKVKNLADITPTMVLRSRKALESLCDTNVEELTNQEKLKTISFTYLDYICEAFKLYALFEYSFGQHELELSTTVLTDAAQHLSAFLCSSDDQNKHKLRYVIKTLLRYAVHLAKHHMNVNTAPLSTLRHILQIAINLLPNNSYFLQVFVEMELKMYISGRLDRHFSHKIQSADSPIPVLFAVYSILCRQFTIDKHLNQDNITSSGGLINRIRSYLERSLNNTPVNHCPLVWRLYLYCEIQYGNQSRAKGIFYRALQSCPWSKALYLDAVSLFSGDKMEEIVDLMAEKEIRLQIPLEEIDILLEEKGNKDNI